MAKEVVLVVGPLAVASTWRKEVATANAGFTGWDHQELIASRIRRGRGSFILAQMGTGKTLSVFLGLDLVEKGVDFVDISTGPAHARVSRLAKAMSELAGDTLLVYVNHDSVWRTAIAKAVSKLPVTAVVIDESHRIKSPSSKVSMWAARVAKQWPKAKRIAMTGTPCPNNPLDLYGQVRFVSMESLHPVTNYTAYRSQLAVVHPEFRSKVLDWKNDGLAWITGVVNKLSVQIRATDVLKDLPQAIHQTIDVKLSPKTRRFYDTLEKDFVAKIDAGEVTATNAMTLTLRLRQATGGQTNVEGYGTRIDPDSCDKRAALEELLGSLDEPVVVFTNFASDMEEVAAACRTLGLGFSELSGRRKQLEQWQRGETAVIGVQIQAGGVGIDLTRSRVAIYYGPTWSLGDYEQSLARIRRPGQTSKHCLYLHLIAEDTIDVTMHHALRAKQRMVDVVIEGLAGKQRAVAR